MKRTAACMLLLAGSASAIDNGIGLLPPMGWRSWNCYGAAVTQDLMQGVMDKMAERKRKVDGKLTSLVDLGYANIGLDDNWQACGTGVNASFHDANGSPLINTTTFPDMKAMTTHGHSKGMRVGWYMNNCICAEHNFTQAAYEKNHMENSVKALVDLGFDGVKLDGCGQFLNLTWWAQLINETGRPIMIENCHWGFAVPGQTTGQGPCSGVTDISDCPYNFYRTSYDIHANWWNFFKNLQTTVPFLGNPPLARPGAWAYPDMLEVGNMKNASVDRAHFAAWCIMSSPLILGYDVTNDTTTDRIWDIISNPESLQVSQSWFGHPGGLLKSWDPPGRASDPVNQTLQIWSKPMGIKDTAVLVLNNDLNFSYPFTITMTDIGFSATDTVKIRDIHERKDAGTATGTFVTDSVDSHDSRFYRFSL